MKPLVIEVELVVWLRPVSLLLVKVCRPLVGTPNDLPQDRRTWDASIRDVVTFISDASSTGPG